MKTFFVSMAVTLIMIGTFGSTVYAIPTLYTFSGPVTGTATLDFSVPDGGPNSVINYTLNFNGMTYSPSDVYTDSTRFIFDNAPLGFTDIITLTSGMDIQNRIFIQIVGPLSTPLPRGTWTAALLTGGTPPPGASGTFTQTPVPEPTSMLLLASGLLGLAGYRWQQRRREGSQVG